MLKNLATHSCTTSKSGMPLLQTADNNTTSLPLQVRDESSTLHSQIDCSIEVSIPVRHHASNR